MNDLFCFLCTTWWKCHHGTDTFSFVILTHFRTVIVLFLVYSCRYTPVVRRRLGRSNQWTQKRNTSAASSSPMSIVDHRQSVGEAFLPLRLQRSRSGDKRVTLIFVEEKISIDPERILHFFENDWWKADRNSFVLQLVMSAGTNERSVRSLFHWNIEGSIQVWTEENQYWQRNMKNVRWSIKYRR